MTSSLVGSEMCIRDRLKAVRFGGRPAAHPRGAPAQQWVSGARPGRRAAVSYTHLTLPTICSV
eukprot:6659691-Prorocentrum_lima.AAC.1